MGRNRPPKTAKLTRKRGGWVTRCALIGAPAETHGNHIKALIGSPFMFLEHGPGLIVRKPLRHKGFPQKRHLFLILWDLGLWDRAGLTGRLSRSVPAGNLPECRSPAIDICTGPTIQKRRQSIAGGDDMAGRTGQETER